MMDFSKSKLDLIGKAKLWYTISIIVIALGLVGIVKNMATEGFPLIRGIDFAGGSILQIQYTDWDENRDTAQLGEDLVGIISEYTEKTPRVLTTLLTPEENGSESYGLLVQIRADASLLDDADIARRDEMDTRMRELGGEFDIIAETEVGAVIGKELASKAVQGVLVGLILILAYITFRLSFDFAAFAVIALFHDVLILVGMYALFGIEINSPFVAILLTVVGYSINDTIVIYDRIRENMKVKRHLPFDKIVNQSLLETLARSINTSATTLLAILALLIFGGESLRTFMVGLGIGVVAGTYSSIFVASMLLVSWRLKQKGVKRTLAADGPVVTGIMTGDDSDEDLIDLDGEQDDDGIQREPVEPIKIDQPPKQGSPKRGKPKRRRRR